MVATAGVKSVLSDEQKVNDGLDHQFSAQTSRLVAIHRGSVIGILCCVLHRRAGACHNTAPRSSGAAVRSAWHAGHVLDVSRARVCSQ